MLYLECWFSIHQSVFRRSESHRDQQTPISINSVHALRPLPAFWSSGMAGGRSLVLTTLQSTNINVISLPCDNTSQELTRSVTPQNNIYTYTYIYPAAGYLLLPCPVPARVSWFHTIQSWLRRRGGRFPIVEELMMKPDTGPYFELELAFKLKHKV